jgi:hypothetical protein
VGKFISEIWICISICLWLIHGIGTIESISTNGSHFNFVQNVKLKHETFNLNLRFDCRVKSNSYISIWPIHAIWTIGSRLTGSYFNFVQNIKFKHELSNPDLIVDYVNVVKPTPCIGVLEVENLALKLILNKKGNKE